MKKKNNSLERYHSRNGFLFTLPWFIGFLVFSLIPIIQSVIFSFCNVETGTFGLKYTFVGLDNFKYALFQSPLYVDNLVDTLNSFISQMFIIVILSMIIAIILNPSFKGRTFFRALFFIPVIISTGVVMQYIAGDTAMEEMRSAGTDSAATSIYFSGLIDFKKVFTQLNLPTKITNVIMAYVSDIFDLVWNCGIQILLFISGLQTIPDHLYEVSKVDGATKWEEFWYVTFPCLSNTVVLVMVYTAIDFCISNSNKVMEQAYHILTENQVYGKSSAMIWLYFAVAAVVMGIVLAVFQRFFLRKWEN